MTNTKDRKCYHCGDDCGSRPIVLDDKDFCCIGCKTVFEIFSGNGLSYYYDLHAAAGSSPKPKAGKYNYLTSEVIVDKLVEFNGEAFQVVNLYIPHIHCSSCIWLLENLTKLHPSISSSQVDFPNKTVRITYSHTASSLREVVELLERIGYEPYISLDDYGKKKKEIDRGLIYKLGIAGFAFGNVMFLSFPEYFDLFTNGSGGPEFWLEKYKTIFRLLMFLFSVPVVFYAGRDYFISAYKGLRSGFLNIDVPIALGILVLFLRSTVDVIFDLGPGFFDSLTGLVFFLLLGKFFQQKTYSFLSFERDYKSFFPIAVTRIMDNGSEENVPIYEVEKGDRILIRNGELIPMDGLVLQGLAELDYSFVTGESDSVRKDKGEMVFAGGKQLSGAIEVEAVRSVHHSHLTQLWGNFDTGTHKANSFQSLTDSIGKRFTIAVLTIAIISSIFWFFFDSSKVLNVFTAVLIIACPCAIALAAPFTLGNMLRIFGMHGFYVKDTATLEKLAQIDTAIFDKTGTITSNQRNTIAYEGSVLNLDEESLLKTTLRSSNHPLSRSLYQLLREQDIDVLDDYKETLGEGIMGVRKNRRIKIGSAQYVGWPMATDTSKTQVHISANDNYKGCFSFETTYRPGLSSLFNSLSKTMDVSIVSGDHAGEKKRLEKILPGGSRLLFDQKPKEKLEYVKNLQNKGSRVMMVGDGLNDAGALLQSDVGVAISENVNVFSPACDAILDASRFQYLAAYQTMAKTSIKIIKLSFMLSLLYNVVGTYFAVTGQLQPIIAAILMPLSSISVVGFTSLATNMLGRRLTEPS
ncbi:heavy metal translocating P-type ATPase metal-binding domain-containing protein [Flavobacteriaceae bacterium F89]|uniref:Heavy metal translocating P-type ATPase metal-binding domain-containing protein n=2 Tax=Cerina litoralis TaxID=2874477 RepID=A0AAE3JS36_9FLAO|nr:heavy metal translocating P-type ATPase metal-binding domain-containing protein [Cerina litoralis]